jgi:hypothetical protein
MRCRAFLGANRKRYGKRLTTTSRALHGYGTWKTDVCADGEHKAKESNEKNNCRHVALAVIPRSFAGTFQGSRTFFGHYGVTERWQGEVTFHWASSESPPTSRDSLHIHYVLVAGSITYAAAGTDEVGRAFFGSGTTTLASTPTETCELTLSYYATHGVGLKNPVSAHTYYTPDCRVDPLFRFPVSVHEDGLSIPLFAGPSASTYLEADGTAQFGFTELTAGGASLIVSDE